VIQELSERDSGTVSAPLTVAEPVDDVAGEVTTGRIVEPAAALIDQHEEGSSRHHLRDACDPESRIDLQSLTVVVLRRRNRSPALGQAGGLDPEKASAHARDQPARGRIGDQSIERRHRAHVLIPIASRGRARGARRCFVALTGRFHLVREQRLARCCQSSRDTTCGSGI
jgi:hypothetical protein